ncbi:hypothetical protein GCM10027431_19890 [Lysobacter rhizosphaerae]
MLHPALLLQGEGAIALRGAARDGLALVQRHALLLEGDLALAFLFAQAVAALLVAAALVETVLVATVLVETILVAALIEAARLLATDIGLLLFQRAALRGLHGADAIVLAVAIEVAACVVAACVVASRGFLQHGCAALLCLPLFVRTTALDARLLLARVIPHAIFADLADTVLLHPLLGALHCFLSLRLAPGLCGFALAVVVLRSGLFDLSRGVACLRVLAFALLQRARIRT